MKRGPKVLHGRSLDAGKAGTKASSRETKGRLDRAAHPFALIERLRNRREMVNYGHGNVADVPDDDCMAAADEIERQLACRNEMLAALQHAEVIMTFVPPRTAKAEYLGALAHVRAALAKAKSNPEHTSTDRESA